VTTAGESARRRDTRSATPRLLGLVAVLAALFVTLAVFVALHPRPTALDRGLDRELLANRGSVSFEVWKVITVGGSAAVVTVAVVVLALTCWIRGRHKTLAALCIVAVALAGLSEVVVKPIVGRRRPSTRVFTHESGFGFPSGHTTGAAAFAVVAVIVVCALVPPGRRRAIAVVCAVAYAVLIALSRVVVGAHYATDVLGGVLLGVTVAIVVTLTVPMLLARGDRRRGLSPCRCG
jgi:membrane-associated phospholipid phosphatase